MDEAAGRGDRLDRESVFDAAASLQEGYAPPECDRHDHQVHEVDQIGLQELAHRRGPPPMRTSRPSAAACARRSTWSGDPSTKQKLVPLAKSIVGCGWWLITNTGVRNGGSSPHQPRQPSSAQSPTCGPNLRRPMISAPMP